MRKKVFVLGHQSSLYSGFRKSVDSLGPTIHTLDTLDEFDAFCVDAHPDLIIFVYDHNHANDYHRFVDWANAHLETPVIFILSHDQVDEAKINLSFSRSIERPLSCRSSLLKKIETYLALGQYISKRTSSDIEGIFDTLDLNAVIDKVFRHFRETVSSRNIHWITRGELSRIYSAIKSNSPLDPEQSLNRSVQIQSLVAVDEFEVFEVIRQLELPNNYFRNSPVIKKISLEEGEHYLFPIDSGGEKGPVAYIIFESLEEESSGFLEAEIQKSLKLMARHIGFSVLHWEAQSLSFVDDLTGLYNQKYLDLVVQNEISRSQRKRGQFSVMFLDIDHFKSVNDRNGHWVGSKVLIDLGKTIKDCLRSSDYAFRYGGDEFVMVLPETGLEGAKVVAERIRSQVESQIFIVDDVELKITVSVGLATYPDHASTHKDIIKMADEAMYCGKNQSRNVVYIAS